jgi:hypothetical protein
MRDVRRVFSIGLPAASFVLCVAVALTSPSVYRTRVRRHEAGLLEHGTVVCLVPAVALGALALRRRHELPAKWLGAWIALVSLGALYYAGEECSWGQNYFGWMTPEGWAEINDQNETNLHNTSSLFDHVPRGLLSIAAGVCVIAPFVLGRRRAAWEPRTNSLAWLFPTMAVVPAAAFALAVSLPQRLTGKYDKSTETVSWFAEMFLGGRASELKEFFLAMFILMYVWSFATRLASLNERSLAGGTDEDAAGHLRGGAAGRAAA